MKDAELKRNASGYYDEPCYRAVTAPPKPGEIWTHAQGGHFMIILAERGGVYSTLRLTDKEREGGIPVHCRAQMYTMPIMIGYTYGDNMGEFVRSIKGDEFKTIKKAVADALGLGGEALEEREAIFSKELQAYNMAEEIAKLKCELEARETANELLRESLEKVSREADRAEIYREMYTTLLDKVISARGEA